MKQAWILLALPFVVTGCADSAKYSVPPAQNMYQQDQRYDQSYAPQPAPYYGGGGHPILSHGAAAAVGFAAGRMTAPKSHYSEPQHVFVEHHYYSPRPSYRSYRSYSRRR